jgi:hypothetical protein
MFLNEEARLEIAFKTYNPIPTRLCHVIYCHGDKSYPCGIWLRPFKNIE